MRVSIAAIALCIGGGAARAQSAPVLDHVLVGGRVLDPETNLDAVRAVGITGGRIVSVTADVPAARDTVNVAGLVVAPGFIDLHSHGQDSTNYRFFARDGVTTALELELGTYPVAPWYAAREGTSLINYGVSAGHPGARRAMLDADSSAEGESVIHQTGRFVRTPIASARLPELQRRIDAALDDGALGVGMGINYTPAATREEIYRTFQVAARHHAPVFVHMRYPGLIDSAGVMMATQEVLADAAATGAPLHIVHVTSMALALTPTVLGMIDSAHAHGVDVTTEAYPYNAGATTIQSAVFDPGFRERLGIDYKDLLWVATGERLTAESFARYRQQGGLLVLFVIPDSVVSAVYRDPRVIVASDGGFQYANGVPIGHPRSAGTHARVLGRLVREQGVMTLMDGVRRMTLLPAQRLEQIDPDMKHKGRVQAGADADLVVFDPARVLDRSTFEHPAQYSDGIVHVLVNGTFVVRSSQLVPGVSPGKPVRAPHAVAKQGAAPQSDAFRRWAAASAIPLPAVTSTGAADLDALQPVVGDATVVGIGEPMHGAHEPLAFRNQLVRFLVERMGFTAVALESGFTDSRAVARLVDGAPGDVQATVQSGITWGFGNLDENVELVRWLRDYNADPAHRAKVHFYGMDLSGGKAGAFPSSRPPVDSAIAVLQAASGSAAAWWRRRLEPELVTFTDTGYARLSSAQRGQLRDDLSELRSALSEHRSAIVQHASAKDYAWALHNVDVAEQLAVGYDLAPKDTSKPVPHDAWRSMQQRDSSMAANVRWILAQEGAGAKLVVFAHDAHIMNATLSDAIFDAGDRNPTMLGVSLRAMLGERYRPIGMVGAVWTGPNATPLDTSRVDAALLSVGRAPFALDLRRADNDSAANAWLSARRPLGPNRGDEALNLEPRHAFDALVFIDTLTPAHRRHP